MDAIKTHARRMFHAAYAQNQQKPRPHHDQFHLAWTFDAAVVAALLIAVVGYLTA
jgi:hypothetical protein